MREEILILLFLYYSLFILGGGLMETRCGELLQQGHLGLIMAVPTHTPNSLPPRA
jgi:hypothetical protein